MSGVVDWEGCGAGDRSFDLATLFYYSGGGEGGGPDHRERLWCLLRERTEPRLLRLYLAHLVLRQVDWSIRFHDRSAVARWLRHSEEVMRRFPASAGRTDRGATWRPSSVGGSAPGGLAAPSGPFGHRTCPGRPPSGLLRA
ncbi:MAG: hypothetical protein M3Q10_10045 [Chloroflexota bacterium]|nr:hypothetical protein [Chloroflexota bacterium]